jgi:hypothetical protein
VKAARRTWSQQGYTFIEPAEESGGEGYWIDGLGRIGLESDDGSVTWHVVDVDRLLAVEKTGLDDAMVALEHVGLHGVVGQS